MSMKIETPCNSRIFATANVSCIIPIPKS